MMKLKNAYIVPFLITILLYGCNKQADDNSINISGSDTELSMVESLAENFNKRDSSSHFKVKGGGSQQGITDLIENKSVIANSSRIILDSEIEKAKKNGVEVLQIMFATDALVIITNSKLGVDSLTLKQVEYIFAEKIINWKEVGGPDLPINIYTRDSLSGTHWFLKHKFNIGKIKSSKTLNNTGEIIKAIRNDIGGISYSGLQGVIEKDGKPNGSIWSMPISIDEHHKAITPLNITSVMKGEYPLKRPLYQFINKSKLPLVKNFILYELSGDGQREIGNHGFYPINDYQKQINLLNGFEF